MILHHTFYFKN